MIMDEDLDICELKTEPVLPDVLFYSEVVLVNAVIVQKLFYMPVQLCEARGYPNPHLRGLVPRFVDESENTFERLGLYEERYRSKKKYCSVEGEAKINTII
jgi:hypothetical protein